MRSLLKALPVAVLALAAIACGTANSNAPGVLPLSDGEVAMIVRTANQGEVNEGEQARTRASSAAVRDFAAMMVSEHGAAMQRVGSVASGANLTMVESAMSRNLASNSAAAQQSLGTWSGAEFDRRYMDRQIAVHEFTLSTIESTLLANARNRQLRTLLSDMRATVATHLQRAREVRGAL